MFLDISYISIELKKRKKVQKAVLVIKIGYRLYCIIHVQNINKNVHVNKVEKLDEIDNFLKNT